MDSLTLLGFAAGAITSIGFIPQLVKGFRTKKLDDVSYWMPFVLIVGMSLWLVYGIARDDIAIIVANLVAVTSSVLLVILKWYYSPNRRTLT